MIRNLLIVILALAGLCTTAAAQSDIRKVDFRNFTYAPYCASDETQRVTVSNGEFSKETQMDGYIDRFYFTVFDFAYGDLNGDNQEEAVVLSSCNTGGTGNFSEGFVYGIKSGKPTLLARIGGGDRADGGLRRAWIESGVLSVDRNYMGDTGASCCPEEAEITRYRLNGGKLGLVGSPVRRMLYPEQTVKFDRGKSGTTFRVKLPADEGKRLIVGARSGQTLDVSVSSEKASLRLLEDAQVTEGVQNFRARLPKSGNYTIEVRNDDTKDLEITVNIKIQ